jgi:uncharacterized membrane protein YtjA (UPF0391 family)
MIRWAVTFLIIALVSALFGFTNVAGTAFDAAKLLFVVFLVLAVLSLVFGSRTPPGDIV